MPQKKAEAKLTGSEPVGLSEASGEDDEASSANEVLTWGNQQVLTAIACLDAKLTQMKVDICDSCKGRLLRRKRCGHLHLEKGDEEPHCST